MRRPLSWQLNTTLVKCVCETPLQKPAAWNSVLKGHLHLCKRISVGQLFHCLNLDLHPYGGSTCLPVGGRSLDHSLTSEGAKRLWMMDTVPHRVVTQTCFGSLVTCYSRWVPCVFAIWMKLIQVFKPKNFHDLKYCEL